MTTPNVQIPEDLRGCHPLITKTRQLLKQTHFDERTLKHAAGAGTLYIRVSQASIDRALRILEAVIRACESRGWVVAAPDEKSSAEIRIGEDPVSFGISEKISRFEINSDDPEKSQWYWRPCYRYEATGLLTLEILDYPGDGMRRTWSDGKRQRLEDLLPEFIDGAERTSDALSVRRLEREEWQRQCRIQELQRQELALKIKKEAARRDRLVAELHGWSRAQALRGLIAQVKQRSDVVPGMWPKERLEPWVAWAEGLVGHFDPFVNGYFSQALAEEGADAGLDCRQIRS